MYWSWFYQKVQGGVRSEYCERDYGDFMCARVPLTGEYHSGWLWNPEAVCGDTRQL